MKLLRDNIRPANLDQAKPHWVAVLCLATFFCVSGFSLLVGQVIDSSLVTNGILVVGAIVMFVPYYWIDRRYRPSHSLKQARIALAAICLSALITAFFIAAEDQTRDAVLRICFLKTGGLMLVSAAVAIAGPLYRPREVSLALLLFVVVEFLVVAFTFLFFDVNFNANTVGSRTSTIGLVAVATFSPLILRGAGLIGSLALSVALQCRTSAVATTASVFVANLEARSRRSRFVVVIGLLVFGVLAGTFADDAQREAKRFAIRNLGSNHPVASFFLDDKNRAKIDSDFLDRNRVWKATIKQIKKRPILGFGVGTEMKRFRMRAHNAYLSVAVEGGMLFLVAWLILYGIAMARLFNGDWSERYSDLTAGRAMLYLFAYMLLSAMVESSGLGSISSPVNIIFLFLLFWTSQWYSHEMLMVKSRDEERELQRLVPRPSQVRKSLQVQ